MERVRVHDEGFFNEEIETPGLTPGGVPARPATPEELDLWENRAVKAREAASAENRTLTPEYLEEERREHDALLAKHAPEG